MQQSSSAVQHRCPIYTCTNRSLLAVWHWYTEIRCAESINKTTRPSVGKLLQVETDKNRVFPISPLVTTNYCQALSPWKSNFAAIRSKHFHASSMKDVFSYFTFTPNILSISIIFICLYFHLECMALNSLIYADVPLRIYILTHWSSQMQPEPPSNLYRNSFKK